MKIGLQTWGSDGDIRPFLALASGLCKAGHDVSIVITSVDQKDYTHFGKVLGFSVTHVGDPGYFISSFPKLVLKLSKTRVPFKQIKIILEDYFFPVADEMYTAALELCSANDVLISHNIHHPAQAAAQKSGKPYISVTLYPRSVESKYNRPDMCPNIGNWANPWWWKICYLTVDKSLRSPINQFRKKHDLPMVKNILKEVWTSKKLNLIAVSSALCQKQPDWLPAHKVCGFFNMNKSDEKWEIPADLNNFLTAGSPPVYLTVGSIISQPSFEIITKILVDGARKAGCRAIVQSRWDELNDFPEYPEIYKIQTAPHQHIFQHCAAVVHHGGAGTAQTSLFHGCPSVIIEHFGDQLLWANELRRIGVAAKPLHRRNITANRLAKAIRTVLDSQEMKKRAKTAGATMREENGVDQAVIHIEEMFP